MGVLLILPVGCPFNSSSKGQANFQPLWLQKQPKIKPLDAKKQKAPLVRGFGFKEKSIYSGLLIMLDLNNN
jgi:hypothetical protein|tara:strand:- start:375 stop:587 length:213 start_codon:yes stop_codon:yes gene_type:complete